MQKANIYDIYDFTNHSKIHFVTLLGLHLWCLLR